MLYIPIRFSEILKRFRTSLHQGVGLIAGTCPADILYMNTTMWPRCEQCRYGVVKKIIKPASCNDGEAVSFVSGEGNVSRGPVDRLEHEVSSEVTYSIGESEPGTLCNTTTEGLGGVQTRHHDGVCSGGSSRQSTLPFLHECRRYRTATG